MAEETHYTAKNGIVVIATANTNLDGSGTLGNIITAASNGTLIKKLYIKAIDNTTQGMIRIFVYDGTNNRLFYEVEVPAITCSGTTPTFEIELPLNFNLKAGYILKAATQNAETFNIIAEALDWTYYGSAVRTDTTEFTTVNRIAQLSAANVHRNGGGSIYAVYIAGSSATYKGSSVKYIIIKNTGTVNDGMIRLFIYNGSTQYLFKEVFVATQMGSDFTQHFEHIVDFDDNDFELQAGYRISASTQFAETYAFEVSVTGNDWKYLP